ncbi:F-box domain containing protein [Tanacetum coccineum]
MFQFTKTTADESGDCSSFSHLPDEIVLQILSKLFDFKTLCVCKLVSPRFNQIVNQVDTISYNVLPVDRSRFDSNTSDPTLPKSRFWSLINHIVLKPIHLIFSTLFTPIRLPVSPSLTSVDPVSFYQSESFLSAIKSLHRFTRLKSLRVEVPSSLKDVDNRCLFKWKMSFVNRIDSYVFLSPNSIFDTKGVYANGNVHDDEEREDMVLSRKKWDIGMDCFQDAVLRRWMLMDYISNFPLLEDVSVDDTNKRGRISVSGVRKIAELRKWLNSLSETTLNRIDRPRASVGYVPFLELPVSGYVMRGVFLLLVERDDLPDDNFDRFLDLNLKDSEDKKESAYNEAIMEIFKKHRGNVKRLS